MFLLLLMNILFAEIKWDTVTCPSNIDLAKELVEKTLSGESVYSKSTCWKQEKFPHIKLGEIFLGEETTDSFELVDSYKINEVKEIVSEFGPEVVVSFSLHTKDKPIQNERLSFIRLDTSPNKAFFGCAVDGSIEVSRLYLLTSCK